MSSTKNSEEDPMMKAYLEKVTEDMIKEVHWEFDEWIEKAVGECLLKGIDDFSNTYIAEGIYFGGEIVEVSNPEMVTIIPEGFEDRIIK